MSTPTPTQAENDKIKLGEEVTLADDGSGPDPHAKANEEAKQQTVRRQASPDKTTAPKPQPSPPSRSASGSGV